MTVQPSAAQGDVFGGVSTKRTTFEADNLVEYYRVVGDGNAARAEWLGTRRTPDLPIWPRGRATPLPEIVFDSITKAETASTLVVNLRDRDAFADAVELKHSDPEPGAIRSSLLRPEQGWQRRIVFYQQYSPARLLREMRLYKEVPHNLRVRMLPEDNRPLHQDLDATVDLAKTLEQSGGYCHDRDYELIEPRTGKVWAEVVSGRQREHWIKLLYQRAATLAKDEFSRHYYLACSYRLPLNRDKMWDEVMRAYRLNPEDPRAIRNLCEVYRHGFETRDELCVLLSKYLQIAPDWPQFIAAYDELQQIRYACGNGGDAEFANCTWEPSRMPLRVAFGEDEGFQSIENLREFCIEALDEWTAASGGKISWTLVEDVEQADIVCGWKADRADYTAALTSNRTPRGIPREKHLGLTTPKLGLLRDKIIITNATVSVLYPYDFSEDGQIPDQALKYICMHEIGHALGVGKHLKRTEDVMYPSVDIRELDGDGTAQTANLSQRDKAAIAVLYRQYPSRQNCLPTMQDLGRVCWSYAVQRTLLR